MPLEFTNFSNNCADLYQSHTSELEHAGTLNTLSSTHNT